MPWNEEVAARDYLPVEERRTLQLKRLQDTVRGLYENVQFYQVALYEGSITPDSITSL